LAALEAALDQTELQIVQENAQAETPGCRLPAGLGERQALREQIRAGLAQLAADGRQHYHPVEPEARRMKVSGRNRFAYNAQAVADGQEGVIVACEVIRQETDAGQLVPLIEAARENLGVAGAEPLSVADGGYGAGADLQAAAEQQLPVLAPPAEGKPAKDNPYASQHFKHAADRQTVTCPREVQLDREGGTTKNGVWVERYRCHCRDCPVRAQCTSDPKGRQIEIWPHTPAVQAMRERLKNPATHGQWRQRREIIERRFGQVKQHDGFVRWTVWGLESVRTQWSLVCTTLNLRILYQHWRGGRQPQKTGSAAKMMNYRVPATRFLQSCLLYLHLAFQRALLLRPWESRQSAPA
jgi:hypothetical protein